MALAMESASRNLAKLKIGLSGPSGAGKTLSSLLLGYGLIKSENPRLSDHEIWQKICVIDTENRSASLCVGKQVGGHKIGKFQVINLPPPFHPKRYIEAIEIAENAGIGFLIIDSATHAWTGEGGALDLQGAAADRLKNTYTAWREVTPLHNRLVDKILQSTMHVCANLRSKTEYVLEENSKGKQVPHKVGMNPIFREGFEYELTVFLDLERNHTAHASKDRTGLFDGEYFVITPKTGELMHDWLASGDEPTTLASPSSSIESANPAPESRQLESLEEIQTLVSNVIRGYTKDMEGAEKQAVAEEIKQITGGEIDCMKITDKNILRSLWSKYNPA